MTPGDILRRHMTTMALLMDSLLSSSWTANLKSYAEVNNTSCSMLCSFESVFDRDAVNRWACHCSIRWAITSGSFGPACIVVCRNWASAYIVIIRNRFFSRITLAILNRSGWHSIQWWEIIWDALLKTLGPSFKGGQNCREKKRSFCQGDKVSAVPFLWGSFARNLETISQSIWSLILSENNCEITRKGPLTPHTPQNRLFVRPCHNILQFQIDARQLKAADN